MTVALPPRADEGGSGGPAAASPRGRTAPLEALLENRDRFLAFLERRLGSREEAEDLLQDAYLRGVGRLGSLRESEKVTAWFYRLLRNALTDHRRRRDVERRALETLASAPKTAPAPEELMAEVCSCIRDLLPTLRADHAEALLRVDLEGARVADFAKRAGISANNASVRLHRARQAMRRRLLEACGCCAEHGCLACDCRRGGR
jgi:RNA polymerase sigma-70 factor (ECF subfamily)